MAWTREDLGKRSDEQIASISSRVLNRVAKWRSVFAGWQLGTRSSDDPESQAIRDHREATLMLRIEVNALTALLIDAGIITPRSLSEQVILEAEHFDQELEKRFPGMRSTDDGIEYSLPEASATMKGWLP